MRLQTPPVRAGLSPMPRDVRRAALVGALAAAIVYLLLASVGDLHLADARYTSDFYDVQARRLFHGHLTVPRETFGIEAFVVDGHTHTYFGPLPSIIRMPILLVTSHFDGRLGQVSMAAAFAVLLAYTARLSWRVRSLVRPDEPVDRLDLVVGALAPFVVGAGSVALYLGASSIVYHEAILWGIATAVAASTHLVEHLLAPTRRTTIALGLSLGATLLARGSLGFGVVAAAGVVLGALVVRSLVGEERGVARWMRAVGTGSLAPSRRHIAGLAVAIVLPMAVYVGINEARFHRALGPPYAEQIWTEFNEDRRIALDANGGSLFNVNYVPSTMLAYLRPDGAVLSRLFPFIEFRADRATVIGDAVFDTRDRTASIPAVMPAMTVLSIIGAWSMATRRRQQLAVLRPLVVGGVVSIFGVLSIGFIAHRYLGDFVPLLVPLTLVGLHVTVRALGGLPSTRVRRLGLTAVGALVAVSVWANVGLGLLVQRAYVAPDEETRHEFIAFQQRLDDRLFGDARYSSGEAEPDDGTRGELFVVGPCRQLLWHDSWVWVEIEPLPDGSTPICDRLTE